MGAAFERPTPNPAFQRTAATRRLLNSHVGRLNDTFASNLPHSVEERCTRND